MKSCAENVIVITETKFSFFDRLAILFGATLKTKLITPVTYDMKRGLKVGKTEVRDNIDFRQFQQPKPQVSHEDKDIRH